MYFLQKYIKMPYIILIKSTKNVIKQDGIEYSGYLAFLSILSLFPFLIFLVSITSIFDNFNIGIELIILFEDVIPKNIIKALIPRLEEIVTSPPQSLLTIAIIGTIWTASSTVEGLRTALNRAYLVKSPPKYIFRRLLSILQFFIIVFSIILIVLILVILPIILKKINITSSWNINYNIYHYIIYIVLIIGTSSLYYIIPNTKQTILNTFPGSIVCVILWMLISNIFSFYIKEFNQISLLYGSLAGIICALVFFYLMSLIFIIGAKFNFYFRRVYKRQKIYK